MATRSRLGHHDRNRLPDARPARAFVEFQTRSEKETRRGSMNKTATIICLGLAMAGVSPAFADSGKKKDKAAHAQPAHPAHGAPAGHAQVARPAHGAPAIGHSQAAQHASANARMHSRSEVVNGGGPTTVR